MGAVTYTIKAKGVNVKEIFKGLVEEAIHRHGHDSYNGTISTTTLGSNITNKIPADILKNEKKLSDFINDWENNDSILFPEKWETTYVDLGVKHYEAYKPTWIADKQTPPRKKGVTTLQKFSFSTKDCSYGRNSTFFTTLSEVKKQAKEFALSSSESKTLYQYRSDGSKFVIGHFELISDGKKYKSARKSQAKIYIPTKEFIFFVYAAE